MNKTFNSDLCSKCGNCALNCVMGLIEMKDFPEMPGPEAFCNQCGHCEAICPSGAINLDGLAKGDYMDNSERTLIAPEQLGFHMKFRRSIRNYDRKPVEKEKLEEIFDMVRYAPSAGNGQPLEWTVFTDPEKIKEIAGNVVEWMRDMVNQKSPLNEMIPFSPMVEAWDNGMDPILRDAPCLVVAHAPEYNKMAVTDGVIALTHLDLALPSFGMGGCWAGLLNIACNQHHPLKEMMEIPPENAMIYPFMIGYPKYEYQRIPGRNEPNIVWK
ncbi:MAG: nitroreductase family protein [Methanobacteriaceae archaeon]|nr:nitroreductase family protein [Methanobacteriaceae archaeon]MDP2836502.1 nitroreductase family protein [Methanobacteriaceae archaeon]MDP3035959.1 nitroreductase family protein [Methanobacteriaceae archaeon]MDP3484573.1 nitroreductase family protein [Methanobacteriaceae archaeon]MDP3622544.1 nitroreductase family protein [Methanobacteriaceae archaeon]